MKIVKACLLGAMATALVLSAYAGGAKEGSGAPAPAAAPAAAAPAAPATPVPAKDPVIEVTTVRLKGGNQVLFGDDTDEDNSWTRYMEKEFGIKMKYLWTITGKASDFNQKLNLSIMSGEIPDWFGIADVNLYRDFSRAGHLLEVKPLYDKFASPATKKRTDIVDGVLWKAFEVDGKNYSIPGSKFLAQDNKSLWIRQDWLDKLGLKAPTNLKEMYEVAKAFAEKDPDGNGKKDTVGFAFDNTIMSWMASLDPFFGMFGSVPGTWLKGIWVDDGKGGLVYSTMLPGTKDALTELAKWYKEGIVNKDFVTQNENAVAQMISAGTVGMYFGASWVANWPHPDTYKNVPGSKWVPYPLPTGPAAKSVLFDTPVVGGAGVVFGKGFKNFERVMKYYNTVTAEEEQFGYGKLQSEYALGKYFEKDPDAPGVRPIAGREMQVGSPGIIRDPYMYNKVSEFYKKGYHMDAKYKTEVPSGLWTVLRAMLTTPEYATALSLNAVQQPRALVDRFQPAAPGEVHAKVWSFLRSSELETITKIIMGELQPAAFDDFVKTWKSSGGDDLTKEINDWYKKSR